MASKGIKGAQIKASGGRPANLHNPTNIKGHVGDGISIKTTMPKGYVSGREKFMGSQASGKNTVQEARGKHLA